MGREERNLLLPLTCTCAREGRKSVEERMRRSGKSGGENFLPLMHACMRMRERVSSLFFFPLFIYFSFIYFLCIKIFLIDFNFYKFP